MRAEDHQAVRDTFVGQVVEEGRREGLEGRQDGPADQTTPNASADCKM